MDQSIQILRQRIQHRAARRQLNGAIIGAAVTIGAAVAFWGSLAALFY